MHITIAGKLGSGKSTISNILKSTYGFPVYSTGAVQREIAIQHNVSTLEMNKMMKQDISYDRLIDDATTKISIEKKDETIIFDSRMAWKFAVNSFKVFVTVDPLVAAARVMANPRGAVEVYTNVEEAKLKLIERSRVENERFKDFYGVDIFDYSNYNLVIDSTCVTADELVSSIYNKYKEFNETKIESNDIFLSPTSLFPLAGVKDINLETVHNYRNNKQYSREPVSIIAYDEYHYIIDGRHRTLAAAMNNEKLIKVETADIDEHPSFKSSANLISEIQSTGISSVYDFEKIGKFRYRSYPDHYFK